MVDIFQQLAQAEFDVILKRNEKFFEQLTKMVFENQSVYESKKDSLEGDNACPPVPPYS